MQQLMFYGLKQSSVFEGVGCKDVMVWGRHAREKQWESSRLTRLLIRQHPTLRNHPNKFWNGFKQYLCGHMAMCGCHAHLYKFLGILVGRKPFFWTKRAWKWPRHKICKEIGDGTENLRCLTCNFVEIKQGCWNAPYFQLWACYTASWPRNHMFSGVSFTLKARNQVLHHPLGIKTMEWDAETNVLWIDTK